MSLESIKSKQKIARKKKDLVNDISLQARREEHVENRGTKIKEVLWSIVVSFVIYLNTSFMNVPINQ